MLVTQEVSHVTSWIRINITPQTARPGRRGAAGFGDACGLWTRLFGSSTAEHDAVHDALKNAGENAGNDAHDDYHD
jgi:hypothetical protein